MHLDSISFRRLCRDFESTSSSAPPFETPALASRDDCYNGYVVLVTFLNVNYVEEFFVLDEPLGVLKEQIDRMLALALGVARDVGRDDDVWVSPERMAVR